MYVTVKKEIDRLRMIEELILVDPKQYLAIMRTVWIGGFGLNVHRPATKDEQRTAATIERELLSVVDQREAEKRLKAQEWRKWCPEDYE